MYAVYLGRANASVLPGTALYIVAVIRNTAAASSCRLQTTIRRRRR